MNLLSKQTNPDSVTAEGIVTITEGLNSKKYEQKDADGKKVNNDPLNNAKQYANKPASSIPTIFARMLFFNSALLNIDNIDAKEPTTYSTAVSQWLDLLELVFRKGNRLKYVEWKVDEQIDKLVTSKDARHRQLGEALKDHCRTYLPGVESVYLIFDENNRLMGGTSPYTFVYTAPNYKSNQPVRSLLQREEDFQDFVIRLYLMLKNAGVTVSKQFSGFKEYMEEVMRKPKIKERYTDTGSLEYGYDAFNKHYDFVELGSQNILIASLPGLPLHLYMRKEGAIVTDFYMDSNVQPFDALKTPLVLPVSDRKGYSTFTLHDNILWKTSFIVPQDESISYDTKHDLPDNSGVAHTWLTEINFLEDKLVQLPYLVDSKKFYGALNVPTKTTTGASVSYLLPVKPVLMRFFTVEKIKEMIKYEMVEGMIKVTLSVPVRSLEGTPKGHVVFEKTYNPATALYPISAPTFKDVISVGISPFVRHTEINGGLTAGEPEKPMLEDKYSVLLQACSLAKGQDIGLDFVTVGNGSLAQTDSECVDRINEARGALSRFARFYNVKKPFEGLQIQVKNNGNMLGGGMLMPNWDKRVGNGVMLYMYSIDFGTTNTHMAYISYRPEDLENAANNNIERSLKSHEIKVQAQFLAAMPKQAEEMDPAIKLKNYLTYVYGNDPFSNGKTTLADQARMFFPNFLTDEYSFPIRTVVTQGNGALPETAKIFENISIGFHHSKEVYVKDSKTYNYNPNLKWNLEESVGAGAPRTTAKLFFIELLQMVRNHWMQQPDSDLTAKPRFIITYPLAMSNVMGMVSIWQDAYRAVFGEPAKNTFDLVPESLAPAYKLINDGANQTAGLLNVDIGGGTTDLQYYANYGGKIVSRYDSVRFAGDDLWGGGYENIKSSEVGHKPQDANVFTRFTDIKLANANLQLNKGENTNYKDVDYRGKEKINVLLRDIDEAFFSAMQKEDAKEEAAFKAIQLHYAALIYYIANWLKADVGGMAEKFPRKLNFTGFGSKYIPFLFGKDHRSNEKLTDYTKALFKAFGIDQVPDGFSVQFSENPKDVTAEGAALYAIKRMKREDQPKQMRHLGFDGYTMGQRLTWAELSSPEYKERAHKHFDDFIERFQSVDTDLLTPLSSGLVARLKRHATDSFNEMYTIHKPANDADGQGFIKDSLFFWMLKGAIFNLDIE